MASWSRSGSSSNNSGANCWRAPRRFGRVFQEINARLEQLGPAPAAGQTEPEIVTSERQALTSEKAEINAVLGQAESLSIRVNQLVEKIGQLRSDLFRNLLTKRYALADAFDGELADDVAAEADSFYRAVASWLRFVFKFKFKSVLGAAFFAMVAAAVLLVGGRRVFGRLFHADPTAEYPTYLSRLSVAFWSTLLPTAALGAFLGSTLFFLDYFSVLRGDIGTFLSSAFAVIGDRLLRQPPGKRRAFAAAAELAADLDRVEDRISGSSG